MLQMSEQVDDVTVTFEEEECVETDAEFQWKFQIKTEVTVG